MTKLARRMRSRFRAKSRPSPRGVVCCMPGLHHCKVYGYCGVAEDYDSCCKRTLERKSRPARLGIAPATPRKRVCCRWDDRGACITTAPCDTGEAADVCCGRLYRNANPLRMSPLVATPKPSPCPKELPFRCRDGTCAKDWTFCPDRLPRAARPRPGGRPSPQISAAARQPPRGPSAETCFQACCGVFEPDGTNCKSKDAKVTRPNTWTCILNCLKIPDPNPASVGRRARTRQRGLRRRATGLPTAAQLRAAGYPPGSMATRGACGKDMYECGRWPQPGGQQSVSICCPYLGVYRNPTRVQNGCYRPGRPNHPGRAVVACRLPNPGPNGEALPVPPFCAAGECGRLSCGTCNPEAYAVPGAVRTVLEAVAQAQADVDYAMRTASQAERQMYAPGALAWADPSVAILQKPGGPPPGNALPTAEWPHCWGPAAVADPSSNRQPNPGGTR